MRAKLFGIELIVRHCSGMPDLCRPLVRRRWLEEMLLSGAISTRTRNALERAYARDPELNLEMILAGYHKAAVGEKAREEIRAAIKSYR